MDWPAIAGGITTSKDSDRASAAIFERPPRQRLLDRRVVRACSDPRKVPLLDTRIRPFSV